MAIPDLERIMLPMLKILKDHKKCTMQEMEEKLVQSFGLSEEEKARQKPSGGESLFHNRLHWSKFYLKKAGIVDGKPRGAFWLTERGKSVLQENPSKIDTAYLMKFKEFSDFVARKK